MQAFVIAKVLIVNPDGAVLAIRRSETDTRRPAQWDFPGGFTEPNEDILAAVKREAQEEAGITIAKAQLVMGMSEMTPEHGSGTWLTFVTFINDTPEVTLSFEHDDFKWIDPQELLTEITYDRQQKMLGYVLENGLLKKG